MGDADCEGVILDPDNYVDKIGQNLNPARKKSEEGRCDFTVGIRKLIRDARPGAIYDASGAAQTFTEGGIVDFQNEIDRFRIRREKKNTQK